MKKLDCIRVWQWDLSNVWEPFSVDIELSDEDYEAFMKWAKDYYGQPGAHFITSSDSLEEDLPRIFSDILMLVQIEIGFDLEGAIEVRKRFKYNKDYGFFIHPDAIEA